MVNHEFLNENMAVQYYFQTAKVMDSGWNFLLSAYSSTESIFSYYKTYYKVIFYFFNFGYSRDSGAVPWNGLPSKLCT